MRGVGLFDSGLESSGVRVSELGMLLGNGCPCNQTLGSKGKDWMRGDRTWNIERRY